MPVRDLRISTAVITIMVVIDALWAPVVLALVTFATGFFIADIAPNTRALDLAQIGFKIATFVVFGYWIHTAGRNLVDAGVDGLDFTPASRVWWFVVPVANLFKPYQGMRELWNGSHDVWPRERTSAVVATWWATWLLNALVSWIGNALQRNQSGATTALVLAAAAGIVRGIAALVMLHGIARGQRRLSGQDLTHVFA